MGVVNRTSVICKNTVISGTSVFTLASWNKFLSFLPSDSSISPTKPSFPQCDRRYNIHIFQSGGQNDLCSLLGSSDWPQAFSGMEGHGAEGHYHRKKRSKRSQKRWQSSAAVYSGQTVARVAQFLAVCVSMQPGMVINLKQTPPYLTSQYEAANCLGSEVEKGRLRCYVW